MEWVSDYLGIPFVPMGRTREGCDCYGLLRLIQIEHFGRMLPLYADSEYFGDKEEESRLIDEALPILGAIKVDEPGLGDIVLLHYEGINKHIGTFINWFILHTSPRKGVTFERLTSVHLRSRIEGYYRLP
jgi:murein DD-endopeptidase / murein LD-carboxypeptidase